ncbi:MAG: hypothetical protein Q9162_005919 [Coniocarpon cinnabarinum]
MPGRVRNRASLEENEDRDRDSPSSSSASQGSENDESPAQASQRAANKRPRLSNGNGNVDDSWMLNPPDAANARRARNSAAQTNGDGVPGSSIISSQATRSPPETFKPGQLLKVHLRNFVTYTNATFKPGPSLNMVIGPNGTGKSTLVCAICIGLGFNTSHLGRAKELSEFVKHGAKEATVEITLKGAPGKANPEVRLDFSRDGEKKQWHLNGQQCRGKDISTLTSRFGIQIDNLCHFLPQDRVVEFSRLSPKDRLTGTLRATAAPQVLEQHEQLKELATERRTIQNEAGRKQSELTSKKNRQDTQRQDVERIRERQEVVEHIKQLEKLRSIAKHMEYRKKHEETRVRKEEIKASLNQLNAQVEPFDQAKKTKEAYFGKAKKALDLRRKLCDQLEKRANKCKDDQNKSQSDMRATSEKHKAERELYKKRQGQVQKVRQDIINVEAQMEQRPIELDAAEYNRRINAKVREIRAEEEKKSSIREAGGDRQQSIRESQAQIRQTENDLKNLSSRSGQQRHQLRTMSQHTFQAWEWIQENRDKLKGDVYGPALVACTVKDQRYAPMIESLMQKWDFLRITCTNQEDYRFLADFLAKERQLSDYALYRLRDDSGRSRPPLNEREARDIGLEGWAIDFLDGPEPVLKMLGEARLDTTGIMWRDVDDQQFQALESSGLSNLVTSKSSYRVTRRSDYGEGAKSTRVMPVPSHAKHWSTQCVDVSIEDELKQRLAELKDKVAGLEGQQNESRSELETVNQSMRALEGEKEEIQNEKDEKQRHNAMLAALPNKLNGLKRKLEDFQDLETEYQQKVKEIRQEREALILKNGQLAIDYANLVDSLRQKHADVVSMAIAVIEAESDVEQCKKQHSHATQERDRLARELQDVSKKLSELKQKAMDSIDEWRAYAAREPGLTEFFESLSQEEQARTPDELEAVIDALRGRVETLHEGDPNLLQDFEARGREIERLEQKIQKSSERTQELQQQISTIRSTWEPEIDALVEKISQKFSSLFARINCAGSVQVYKPGAGSSANDDDAQENGDDEQPLEEGHDYENWAIQILVKFRENEQLSLLDSHRQSGGERAVTTIYYLMALQKLSRAPFRVVDEINQGMDPRNERIVHERMVDMSCGLDDEDEDEEDVDSKSQYFLITPKLLPGLKYKPGMKVHCIASGEFMPPVNKKTPAMDLGALLTRKRALNVKSEAELETSGLIDGVGA